MRAVVQRVSRARVSVDGEVKGSIKNGLLVYLGVGKDDTEADAEYLAGKIANLRIFEDAEGRMNVSAVSLHPAALVISQFTLYGDARKGNRPAFTAAARPDRAEGLYEKFMQLLSSHGLKVESGVFGAMMDVDAVNRGPVTIMLDSSRQF